MKVVNITGHPFERRTFGELTLARWIARKTIKAEWRASGRHPYDLRVAELNRAAEFFLFNHAELFEEAKALIARDPVLREIDERERKRGAKLTTDAQREQH